MMPTSLPNATKLMREAATFNTKVAAGMQRLSTITDEHVEILKRVWASAAPIDHEGTYYRFRSAYSEVKPLQPHLPIYFGGSSDEAINVAGRHADVYALWEIGHSSVGLVSARGERNR